MSSPVVIVDSNVVLANEPTLVQDIPEVHTVKAPRVKKPALPAKLQRLAVFQFALLNNLREGEILSEDAYEAALARFLVCAPLDLLTAHLDALVDSHTENNKALRKFVNLRNAPPKPPKADKPPKVKAPKADKPPKVNAEKPPKDPNAPKKPRAKKNVIVANDQQDNLVAQLVAAAYDSEPLPSSSTLPTAEVPPTEVAATEVAAKVKKPRVKKDKATLPPTEVPVVAEVLAEVALPPAPAPAAALLDTATNPKKDKKEKTTKESKATKAPKPEKATKESKESKKEKTLPPPAAPTPPPATVEDVQQENVDNHEEQDDADADDGEDIQTREIYIDQVLYLLDDSDGALYSPDSELGNPLLGHLVSDSFVPL